MQILIHVQISFLTIFGPCLWFLNYLLKTGKIFLKKTLLWKFQGVLVEHETKNQQQSVLEKKKKFFSEDIILIHVKKVILAVKSRLCYYYSAKYCPPIDLRWTPFQFKLLDEHRKRLMMLKSWSCTLGGTFIKQGTFSIILLET